VRVNGIQRTRLELENIKYKIEIERKKDQSGLHVVCGLSAASTTQSVHGDSPPLLSRLAFRSRRTGASPLFALLPVAEAPPPPPPLLVFLRRFRFSAPPSLLFVELFFVFDDARVLSVGRFLSGLNSSVTLAKASSIWRSNQCKK
jgi:hypothetical protein